jgi:hypothetical protein
MVQNPANVYVGFREELTVLSINKETNDVTNLAEDGGTLSSLTADSSGFVSVNRKTIYTVYGPDGRDLGGRTPTDGAFLINPSIAVDPGTAVNP